MQPECTLTPSRPAATAVLLRDAVTALEVALLRRHQRSAVLGYLVVPTRDVGDADTLGALTRIGRSEALASRLDVGTPPASPAGMRSVAAIPELISGRNVFMDIVSGVRPKARWITPALASN